MKKSRFASLLLFLFCISLINSQVHVRGYFRKDGTYVSPHIRSSPDGIKENNYSYKSPSTNYYPSSNSILRHKRHSQQSKIHSRLS